eukprot:TRINITY_DN17420_c0_g1_i1.p1 TRINITY_DN17420_c0_g1~~TRINITY_DN17420_c0_g1_i1.p1  ORF type:complete len:223 (-),score=55.95 TRINITY_DN17420_c0_g1_i1:131-748(-)
MCQIVLVFFFFNDTATTEIYTRSIVGSVRCVQETGINAEYMGMDEEKRKLILEVKKQFAELSARRCNLVKKQLENIDSVEAIVVVNSMELEEKKTLYQRKMDELSKQKAQLSQLQEYSKKMGKGNYQTLDISNAQTFLHFDTPFQKKYVHLDSKQKALEEAISQIKKLHNSNSIGLIEFLSIVRKLSSKIFLCIFKKVAQRQSTA